MRIIPEKQYLCTRKVRTWNHFSKPINIAVRKAFRGRGLGADIIKAAEEYAAENGINKIWIHSQEQAAGFYSALGYKDTGIHDVEEGCPHILMKKVL